jgi:hypothetical protein
VASSRVRQSRIGSITFSATLVKRGPGVAVILDDHQVAALGEGAKRFPVAATINGHTWRSTVVRMRGEFMLGLSKEVRSQARIDDGDQVQVELELDRAERTVEVPPALAGALAGDPPAAAAYERLAYTHRKEFVRWIEEAKREETRERRVAKTLEMLRAGDTRS